MFFPVLVNRALKAAFDNHSAGLVLVQAGRFHHVDDHLDITDITAVNELGFVEFIVDRLSTRLGLRPTANLLGQPAVIGVAALVVG